MKITVEKSNVGFTPITIKVSATFESLGEVQNFLNDANGRFDAESDEIVEIVQEIALKLEDL
ncbi:MAG: hypothetical protein ACOCV1_04085 [Bacillota bacterium]